MTAILGAAFLAFVFGLGLQLRRLPPGKFLFVMLNLMAISILAYDLGSRS